MLVDLKHTSNPPFDARKLTEALSGRWYGDYGTAPCPVCQPDRRRDQNGLTLKDGRVGLLLHCKKSACKFEAMLAAFGLGISDYCKPDLADVRRRKVAQSTEALRKSELAKRLWVETLPIEGTLAEAYLRARCIACDLPPSLRFHPQCYHGPSKRSLPAMVALVEGGSTFAIHRTYLNADGSGKAGLPTGDKMMLGSVAGGAVKLSDADTGPIVISEGIESGLSLLSLLDEPMILWAALSASGMRSLHLPKGYGHLKIAADGDEHGRDAAQELAKRAHGLGWRVSILDPGDGLDFNDILHGREAAV